MSVLLDTHVFYWWVTASDRIASTHRRLIEDRDQTIYVSAVTGWEMAIKVKLGKWLEAAALLATLEEAIRTEGFKILDLTLSQAKLAGALDLVHRDPFDRLIAAQSIALDVPILTVDPAMSLLGCRFVEA